MLTNPAFELSLSLVWADALTFQGGVKDFGWAISKAISNVQAVDPPTDASRSFEMRLLPTAMIRANDMHEKGKCAGRIEQLVAETGKALEELELPTLNALRLLNMGKAMFSLGFMTGTPHASGSEAVITAERILRQARAITMICVDKAEDEAMRVYYLCMASTGQAQGFARSMQRCHRGPNPPIPQPSHRLALCSSPCALSLSSFLL